MDGGRGLRRWMGLSDGGWSLGWGCGWGCCENENNNEKGRYMITIDD